MAKYNMWKKQQEYDKFIELKKAHPQLSPTAIIYRYGLDMSVNKAYAIMWEHEVKTGKKFTPVKSLVKESRQNTEIETLKIKLKARNKKIRQLEEEPTILRLEITKLKEQNKRLREIVNGYIRDMNGNKGA